MNNQEMIEKLGVVIGCLQGSDEGEESIVNHYDCIADLIEIQRELKARTVNSSTNQQHANTNG